MKKTRLYAIILMAVLASLLAACGGTPAASSWPGATADQDLTYVSYTNFVYGVRLADGGQAWRYPAEADNKVLFYAQPALIDGQLVVGDFGGKLYSVNPQTGAQNWVYSGATGRYVGPATSAGDLILAPNADNTLYAVNKQGVEVWKFKAGEANWAQPVANDQAVFLGSMDHNLYALDVANGSQLWATDLGASVMFSLAISEDGQTVYAGTLANQLVAVDAGSGEVLWRYATQGNIWARPVVHEEALYFGDQSGTVYAVNAADGSKKWEASAGAPVIGSGALMNDSLVFPTETGAVQAFTLDGAPLWNQSVNGKLYSSPVFAGDRLIVPVTTAEQLLVTMNPNGAQGWAFTPAK